MIYNIGNFKKKEIRIPSSFRLSQTRRFHRQLPLLLLPLLCFGHFNSDSSRHRFRLFPHCSHSSQTKRIQEYQKYKFHRCFACFKQTIPQLPLLLLHPLRFGHFDSDSSRHQFQTKRRHKYQRQI